MLLIGHCCLSTTVIAAFARDLYSHSHYLIELLAAAGNCHKDAAGAPLAALVELIIGGYQLQATIGCNHLK
jgi:hypothetical protein